MTEETTPVAPATETTPTAAPTTTQPVASTSAVDTATVPSWVKELDTADTNMLRKHPRVAAIVGELVGRNMAAEKQRITAESQRALQDQTEAQLLTLLDENEDSIAQRYPAVAAHIKQLKSTRDDRQSQEAYSKALNKMAEAIGRGYQAVPEWKELTPEDHETLAKSVANLPDDDVLPTYNARALDIIAERRATARLAERMAKELTREREAIRKEEAAKLLQQQSAPDMVKPRATPSTVNVNSMSDKEFDEYWEKRFKR